jgi:putative tryptophan/tyrosine transport system substrate-binding protein
MSAFDPKRTLAVHCGNGFGAAKIPVPYPLGEAMRRREFITLVGGAAAWPLAARAQQPSNTFRVGIATIQPRTSPVYAPFDQRLRELGYIEGQNLIVDFLNPEDQAEGIAGAIKELVRRKVDVIVAPYESALKSALATTDTVPILMIAIEYDPLALGYIKNLSRSPGNVTGLFLQQTELAKKRLQMLTDALPGVRTATMFWDSWSEHQWKATSSAAAELGLQVGGVELREQPYDYEGALAQAPSDQRGALIIPVSPVVYRDRQRVADFALRHKIASTFGLREWVEAGGLLSYGVNFPAIFRRAAEYVDRIAKGVKTTDLPIEQPTKFELVLNLKTAKALGITISPAILVRADEVIE